MTSNYNGKWLDCFRVSIVDDPELKKMNGKICLETPSIDYFFTKEQWKEFKEKVNEV